MALESFPPLVLVSARFLISGSLLLAATRIGGARLPCRRELLISAFTGFLTLGIGNGCLTLAEQWIPSGLAALIITVSPFWMVGIEALMPRGERLHAAGVLGLVVGCIGAAVLVAPDVLGAQAGGATLRGFLLLQLGSAAWAFGSIYQRRHVTRSHPIVASAIQQFAAGVAFLAPALLVKETPVAWGFRGAAALLYLVVFGSIVGYSAYLYALKHLRVAVVSLYSYVNPVVAVFLGWLVYREPFGLRQALAMGIIFAGVGLVKAYAPPGRPSVPAEDARAQRAAERGDEREHKKAEDEGEEEISRTAQDF